MGKRPSTDSKLEGLRALRDEGPSPDATNALHAALRDASNHVVAEAAKLAARWRTSDLAPELAGAFDRFMIDPEKRDKMCVARIALVESLNELDYSESELFLTGVRHVQMEPVWGGREDSAAPLRAASAFGLVRVGYRPILPLLVDLLVDPQKVVRLAAVSALAACGNTAALPVLRLKARVGDVDPEVTGECLVELLRIEPQSTVEFVAEFLDGPSAVAELALLALGNSRQAASFDALKACWEGLPRHELRETTLLAMALLRLPAATEFLLRLVREAFESAAALAISAMAIHHFDPRVREGVATALSGRDSSALQELFNQKFPATG